MAANKILDTDVIAAIKAEAKKKGIPAADVDKVLATLPVEGGAKTVERGMPNTDQQLLTLLNDDEDKVSRDVERATGVNKSSARTILLLAAPFLLKYLLGNDQPAQSQQSASPLLSLLGGQPSQPQNNASALLSLLGGQQSQPQNNASALLSLLGGQPSQPQNNASALLSLLGGQQPQQQNNASALLSLLGGQQPQNDASALLSLLGAQQPQSQSHQSQSLLGSLLGGGQPVQQTQSSSGGVMDMLLNILGDK